MSARESFENDHAGARGRTTSRDPALRLELDVAVQSRLDILDRTRVAELKHHLAKQDTASVPVRSESHRVSSRASAQSQQRTRCTAHMFGIVI